MRGQKGTEMPEMKQKKKGGGEIYRNEDITESKQTYRQWAERKQKKMVGSKKKEQRKDRKNTKVMNGHEENRRAKIQ